MAKGTLSTLTSDELRAKLETMRTMQATTTGIFVVIILAWVLLGYWKTNTPVFISTLVVALGTIASQIAIGRGLRAEIRRRNEVAAEVQTSE